MKCSVSFKVLNGLFKKENSFYRAERTVFLSFVELLIELRDCGREHPKAPHQNW